MKILNSLVFLAVISLSIFLCLPVSASDTDRDWTDEDLAEAFDEVARNLGAVEYAIYTFMVEFGRAPESLDELRDSGHLNVAMTNPYTGGEVESLTLDDYPDGDLAGNILIVSHEEGRESNIEAWFVRRDPDDRKLYIRSMVKGIWIYQSEIDYDYFFENDNPRDEQMVAVYCRQAIDAIESYIQKIGETPEDFDEMYEKGDVNVHYINPITDELAESVDDVSPGDFFYEKVGRDGFTLIGWGRDEPVFFATTDEETEVEFYHEWPDEEDSDEDSEDDSDVEDEGVQDCE